MQALAVHLTVVAVLLSGCNAPTSTKAPAFDATAGASFRVSARMLYKDLLSPSCRGAAPGFDRKTQLAPERAAVARLELALKETRAGQQLALARHDAEADGGCWADGDPRFAALHVQMTRDAMRIGLPALRKEAANLPGRAIKEMTEMPNGPAFRAGVRALTDLAVNRPCTDLTSPAEAKLRASFKVMLADFRAALPAQAAAHHDMAAADAAWEFGNIILECAEPDQSAEADSAADLGRVQAQLAALRRLAPATH